MAVAFIAGTSTGAVTLAVAFIDGTSNGAVTLAVAFIDGTHWSSTLAVALCGTSGAEHWQ